MDERAEGHSVLERGVPVIYLDVLVVVGDLLHPVQQLVVLDPLVVLDERPREAEDGGEVASDQVRRPDVHEQDALRLKQREELLVVLALMENCGWCLFFLYRVRAREELDEVHADDAGLDLLTEVRHRDAGPSFSQIFLQP